MMATLFLWAIETTFFPSIYNSIYDWNCNCVYVWTSLKYFIYICNATVKRYVYTYKKEKERNNECKPSRCLSGLSFVELYYLSLVEDILPIKYIFAFSSILYFFFCLLLFWKPLHSFSISLSTYSFFVLFRFLNGNYISMYFQWLGIYCGIFTLVFAF